MYKIVLRAGARSAQVAARPSFQFATTAGIVLLAIWALRDQLAEVELAGVVAAFGATSWSAVAAAAVFAAVSLFAVSAYDALAWADVDRKVGAKDAMVGGFAAISIGQTTGFSPIVGCFVRHRLHRRRGVGGMECAKVSALASFGFLFGLIGASAALLAVRPDALAAVAGMERIDASSLAAGAIVAWIAVAVWIARMGAFRIRGVEVSSPSGRTLLAYVLFAAIDVAFAAAALWMLLPADVGASYDAVLFAFIVAIGAGVMSGAPGGVGVFEAVLIALLPIEAAPLLAAVLAFRVIYYLAPFAVGASVLGVAEASEAVPRPGALSERVDPTMLAPGLAESGRAEAALAHLGDKNVLMSSDGRAFLMYGRTLGVAASLGDPVGARRYWPELISNFLDLCAAEGRTPAFYKTGPATAALCRSMGMKTDRLGHEAEIDVASFALGDRSRRRLRRKVRQAEKAGVAIVAYGPGEAPLASLRSVSDAWLAAKGGRECGFSQGAFREDYLDRMPVFAAIKDGRPVAFASIWRSGDGAEWSIDLIRSLPDAPQGSMQALISAAIESAGEAGARRFNLCMAPMSGLEDPESPLERLFARVYEKSDRSGLKGLRNFKESFDPDWRPRYLCHSGGARTALSLAAIARLVRRVPPEPVEPACMAFEEVSAAA